MQTIPAEPVRRLVEVLKVARELSAHQNDYLTKAGLLGGVMNAAIRELERLLNAAADGVEDE